MSACGTNRTLARLFDYSIDDYAGGLIDETKHCASGGLGIGWYPNSRTAQTVNVQSLMGDGYTVAGVVSGPAGGRGRFPAERQRAFFVLSPRSPIPHPRYAILQTSEIVER